MERVDNIMGGKLPTFCIAIVIVLIFLCSCSYSINMVHTEGAASDVVDEEQIPTATISPPISLTK